MTTLPLPSASACTRLLLAGLALSTGGLAISGFLAGILNAAGDSIGRKAFTFMSCILATALVVQCVALLVTVAYRLEATDDAQLPES